MSRKSVSGLVAAIALAGLTQSAVAQSEPPKTQTEQSGMAPGQAEPPARSSTQVTPPQDPAPPAATHNSTMGAASTDVPMPSVVTHILSPNDAAKFNATAAADDARPTLAHALALTEEQRRLISGSVTGKEESAAPDFKPEVAALMPKSAKVQDIPADVTTKIPWLAPYKYALVGNQILLVDPGNSFVVINILNR